MIPENRAVLERELARREAKGWQLTTNLTWVNCWQRVEWAKPGRSFASLTPEEWVQVVAYLRSHYAATSVYTTCACLKANLGRVLGVGDTKSELARALQAGGDGTRTEAMVASILAKMEGERVLKEIQEILTVETGANEKDGHVLSAGEFHRLLRQNADRGGRLDSTALLAMKEAVLWTFWDSGFRCDEVRMLNVGDVTFDDGGGYLSLPTHAEAIRRDCRLKTKSSQRRIYVGDCTGPIKTWLALHPQGTTATAPLFLGFRQSRGERITRGAIAGWMEQLAIDAGVSTAWPAEDVLSPHDFRHTRCTRAAADNWHPTKSSQYFWGIPDSKMARRYYHLADNDLRDQVRRDLGLADLGYRQVAAPVVSQGMIDDAVRRILAEHMRPKGTQPPAEHELP